MAENENIAAISLEKVKTYCILCSFCENLALKMGIIFQGISRKLRRLVQGWVSGSNQKRIHTHTVGGLVKNMMTLGVRTIWMIPIVLVL